MLDGTIYVCGGYHHYGVFNKKCWMLVDESWKQTFSLKVPRFCLGYSTVGNKLVISGGRSGWNPGYSTTEVVTKDGSEYNVNLPYKQGSHCQVTWNSTTHLIVGGAKYNETIFVNIEDKKWSYGPKLNQGGKEIGCTEFEFNGKQYIIAVGGMGDGGIGAIKTVEYLSKDQPTEWTKGKDFPVKIGGAMMVTSKSKKTVYTLGGHGPKPDGVVAGDIYESNCPGDSVTTCTFTKIEPKVITEGGTGGNSGFPVMTISNELADQLCN